MGGEGWGVGVAVGVNPNPNPNPNLTPNPSPSPNPDPNLTPNPSPSPSPSPSRSPYPNLRGGDEDASYGEQCVDTAGVRAPFVHHWRRVEWAVPELHVPRAQAAEEIRAVHR